MEYKGWMMLPEKSGSKPANRRDRGLIPRLLRSCGFMHGPVILTGYVQTWRRNVDPLVANTSLGLQEAGSGCHLETRQMRYVGLSGIGIDGT